MVSAKNLITEGNVMEIYSENRYVVFVLNNGIRVKIDPNQLNPEDSIKKLVKEEK